MDFLKEKEILIKGDNVFEELLIENIVYLDDA